MPIILVPTSHIAEESIRKIKEIIEKTKPNCVAVELDRSRYIALKEGGIQSTKSLGLVTSLIYSIFKNIQTKLGDIVGVQPGSDMLTAVEFAQSNGIPIYFIDQDIETTILKIKSIKFKEKVRLIYFAFRALFAVRSPKKSNSMQIDLTKVPSDELIDQAIETLQQTFPQIYKILVEDRNQYMAANLKKLSQNYKTVVCVVGAGHYKGLKVLLQSK